MVVRQALHFRHNVGFNSRSSYESYTLYRDGTRVTLWQLYPWFVERMTQDVVQLLGRVLVSNTAAIMTVFGVFVEQEL